MSVQFSKGDLEAKVKTWLDYQERYKRRKEPLLYPVSIEMISNKAGQFEFVKNRIKTKDLRALKGSIIDGLPYSQTKSVGNIINHYLKFFKDTDESESAVPDSPLDFNDIARSVIFLIYLNNKNWTFSGFKQFGCPNDDEYNPFTRQLATFGGQKGILVSRSDGAGYRLKYDFYVTVHQDDCKATDIIIDPRDNDDPR